MCGLQATRSLVLWKLWHVSNMALKAGIDGVGQPETEAEAKYFGGNRVIL